MSSREPVAYREEDVATSVGRRQLLERARATALGLAVIPPGPHDCCALMTEAPLLLEKRVSPMGPTSRSLRTICRSEGGFTRDACSRPGPSVRAPELVLHAREGGGAPLEMTARKVIGFMSDNHIDRDLAVEVFVLEPLVPGAV